MIGRSYLIRTINAVLLFLWVPTLAFAAVALERGEGVEAISWALAGVALLLSTLSGVTALLWRVERELRSQPDKPLLRPWLFAASHMTCSWLAGALAFSLSEAQNLNEWWEVSAVIAASFAGATFVQAAAERLLSKLLPGAMERPLYRPPPDYRSPVDRGYPAPHPPRSADLVTRPDIDRHEPRQRLTEVVDTQPSPLTNPDDMEP